MSEPYFSDDSLTLYHGDATEVLRGLPDASVDCCVTSPPYFGLRDYGTEGQYGLEASPAEYVETMRALFSEVRRVLTDDGTLWLNIGDSYSAKRSYQVDQSKVQRSGKSQPCDTLDDRPAKNLLGIPWRVAFALQDDGWILRNDIIWSKPNAMPESVTDRLSTRHEHLFMLTKSRRYWFDLDPIREPHITADRVLVKVARGSQAWSRNSSIGQPQQASGTGGVGRADGGRNPGDVWTVPTQPFSEAHFAVMPPELARRAIVAGCKPGGTVLDPFSGSGTTGMVANQNGRRYVGIDLSSDYLDLSLRTRLQQSTFIDGSAS